MNDETGTKILKLLDVISIEVAAGRNDIRSIDAKVTSLDAKVTSLDAKVTSLDAKVERIDYRLCRVETRVEDVETGLRSFRQEFERRVAPLERRRPT
jgi:trimeric autotransporter adhesin